MQPSFSFLEQGLLIDVAIGSFSLAVDLPIERRHIHGEIYFPDPNLPQGRALINTGLRDSVIDLNVIQNIGLSQPFSQQPNPNVFSASMYFIDPKLGNNQFGIQLSRVQGNNIVHQGIIAIIGRDILARCRFSFDPMNDTLDIQLSPPWQGGDA